ncbi:MAG: hypothetical protein GY870_13255 [archaeon]|nr:hypothetical protein [archaeon]
MTFPLIPKKFFFTTGTGNHDDKLTSFEYALRDAGCERFNLVPVSSILPPNCTEIGKKEGIGMLNTGEIVYCVMCKISVKEKISISATICNIKSQKMDYGYFIEHSDSNIDHIQNIIASKRITYNLQNSLISINPEANESPNFSENIVIRQRGDNISISTGSQQFGDFYLKWDSISTIKKEKKWITALAMAVFIL